ncbi:hypothetical protein [Actinokineospora enzanensis]|uniref:hypothetical protein n=1 Tax=Actinokineospora enzanensis TaxID=155975 RepID=UPI0005252D21|nr:hypothetical protein [Actinokineospora enzanensis]
MSRRSALAAALLMSLITASPAVATTGQAHRYEITTLAPVPGARSTFAYDIAEDGTAVGFATSPDSPVTAVRWDRDGHPTALPPLDGDGAIAYGVNSAHVVVGQSAAGRDAHAVRWDKSGVHDLGTLPDDRTSQAEEISDNGWVLGVSIARHSRPSIPVRWSPSGRIERLRAPDGYPYLNIQGMNRHGIVYGSASDRGPSVPVLWSLDGVPHILPTLTPGGDDSISDINEHGVAVGYEQVDRLAVPVRWSPDGHPTRLPGGGDDLYTVASHVNEHGEATGWVIGIPVDREVGLRWDADGTLRKLEGSPTGSWNAVGIDDRGMSAGTVGDGTTSHPVVWDRAGHATDLPTLPGIPGDTGIDRITGSGYILGSIAPPGDPTACLSITWH